MLLHVLPQLLRLLLRLEVPVKSLLLLLHLSDQCLFTKWHLLRNIIDVRKTAHVVHGSIHFGTVGHKVPPSFCLTLTHRDVSRVLTEKVGGTETRQKGRFSLMFRGISGLG